MFKDDNFVTEAVSNRDKPVTAGYCTQHTFCSDLHELKYLWSVLLFNCKLASTWPYLGSASTLQKQDCAGVLLLEIR